MVSCALTSGAPPPDTETWFVNAPDAPACTSTYTCISKRRSGATGASNTQRTGGPASHVASPSVTLFSRPFAGVSPAGSSSVITTGVPSVGRSPTLTTDTTYSSHASRSSFAMFRVHRREHRRRGERTDREPRGGKGRGGGGGGNEKQRWQNQRAPGHTWPMSDEESCGTGGWSWAHLSPLWRRANHGASRRARLGRWASRDSALWFSPVLLGRGAGGARRDGR